MSKLKILLLVAILLLSSMPLLSIPAQAAPPSIIYQAPITIDNTQSTATPNPFQQMIQLSESTYKSYITYTGSTANFEFSYANNTIIPAWIESNNSGTLTIWLKIYSIPASSSVTIYIDFASLTANLLSSLGTSGIGEAPQLSPTYAQYDDGASVFNNYWNFAGTSLPTSLVQEGSSGLTVNNGITLSATNGDVLIRSANTIPYPQITDALIQTSVSTVFPTVVIGEATTTNMLVGTTAWLENGYSWDYYSNQRRLEWINSTNRGGVAAVNANVIAGDVYSIAWVNVGDEKTYINYVNQVSASDTTISNIGNYYIWIGVDIASAAVIFQWLRTRAYFPVMPSVEVIA